MSNSIEAHVLEVINQREFLAHHLFKAEFPSVPTKGGFIYRHNPQTGQELIFKVLAVIHKVSGEKATPPEIFVQEVTKMQLRDIIFEDPISEVLRRLGNVEEGVAELRDNR